MHDDVTVVSLSVRFQEIVDHQPAGRALLKTRTSEKCMACWNPETRFHFKTEVFEAWPRRELAPVCVHSGDTPQRRQTASFYNILGDSGSIT